MAKLWKRISRRIQMTISAFRNDCRFSLKLAVYRMLGDLCWRFGPENVAKLFSRKKDEWIMEFLKQELQDVLDAFKEDTDLGQAQENAPIWICWWTGIDSVPPLVKQCIASTYKHAGTHPVHLITQDNYSDYLPIPECMLQKVKDGQMGLAHLADYIRVKLLATYGGLWLDATIYCSGKIPSVCFDFPVFTLKGPVHECTYVSNYRWVTFCLGGWRGNVFYRFLSDAFEEYWSKNSYAVDYLFFDYIILIAYNELAEIRKLLDEITDNNIRRDDLQAAMNRAAGADEWEQIVQPDTVFYKLSWRETYSLETEGEEPSIFAYYLNMKI